MFSKKLLLALMAQVAVAENCSNVTPVSYNGTCVDSCPSNTTNVNGTCEDATGGNGGGNGDGDDGGDELSCTNGTVANANGTACVSSSGGSSDDSDTGGSPPGDSDTGGSSDDSDTGGEQGGETAGGETGLTAGGGNANDTAPVSEPQEVGFRAKFTMGVEKDVIDSVDKTLQTINVVALGVLKDFVDTATADDNFKQVGCQKIGLLACDGNTVSENQNCCWNVDEETKPAAMPKSDCLELNAVSKFMEKGTSCEEESTATAGDDTTESRRLSDDGPVDVEISHGVKMVFREPEGYTSDTTQAFTDSLEAADSAISADSILASIKAVAVMIESNTLAGLGFSLGTSAGKTPSAKQLVNGKTADDDEADLPAASTDVTAAVKNTTITGFSATAAHGAVGSTTSYATSMAASGVAFIGAALLF